MKMAITLVLAAALGLINDIARINKHKSEAQKSYLSGNYRDALQHYQILVDSFNLEEEELLMNYANAAYLLTSSSSGPTRGIQNESQNANSLPQDQKKQYLQTAQGHYTRLAEIARDDIKSLAFNQLGVITFQEGGERPGKEVLQMAKGLFKSALKADPKNEDARHNYELVSKMLQEEEQQDEQDQENEDQQEQDQQEQENEEQQNQDQKEQQSGDEEQEQDQSGEEKDQDSEQQEGEPKESDEQKPSEEESEEQPEEEQPPQPADQTQIEEMKISEEKAKMILEAMKNAEIQYIQQNQRKATKRPDSGKPDW